MDWKPLLWVGSAKNDLSRFPAPARRRAGHELDLVQRAFYVVKFEEGIYVLHAFQKRSRRTAQLDIDVGAKRYREVVSGRSRP